MRRSHCTLTPAGVRAVGCHAPQQTLPWKPFGRRVSVARLLDLLLLVVALPSSLAAVVRRFRFGFSHETARQAVTANLPDRERLGLPDKTRTDENHTGGQLNPAEEGLGQPIEAPSDTPELSKEVVTALDGVPDPAPPVVLLTMCGRLQPEARCLGA
ncbi:MAG TPA: hypothetical protein VNK04_09305, partial [Gemmataceae bacterium]|nr:hypothetical protein [Gemmataceae bacterium]